MDAKKRFEVVDSFLHKSEKAVQGVSSADESLLLTDRRLFSIKSRKRDEQVVVDSLQLHLISRVKTKHESTPDYDKDSVGYGIAALVIAFSALLVGTQTGDMWTSVLIVTAVGVGILGGILILEGYNTGAGKVEVDVIDSTGDTLKNIRLEEDQLHFAEALSATVGGTIDKRSKVTQRMG